MSSSTGSRSRAAASTGAKWSQSSPNSAKPLDRDVRRRLGLALRLERSDDEAAAVVPHVEVPVEVAEEREPLLGAGHGVGHDPHVFGRVERDRRAGHPRELRGPQAGGEDDRVRLDGALVGLDRGHRAALEPEPRHRHAEREHRSAVVRALRERERGLAGVHRRVGRGDRGADQVVDVGDRPPFLHLCRLEHPALHVELTVHVGTGEQLLHPPWGARDGQRSDAAGNRSRPPSRSGAPRTSAR